MDQEKRDKEILKKISQGEGNSRSTFIGGIILGIIAVLVVVLVVFGFGVYNYGWYQNALGAKIVRVFHFPAAYVNYRSLSLGDLLDDARTLENIYAKQAEAVPEFSPPSLSEIKKNVLDRMIKEELVYQKARNYGVKITLKQVDEEFQNLLNQSGQTEEEVENDFRDLYGWGKEQFKKKVIQPFLYQEGLEKALNEDEKLTLEIKQRAEDVLARVKGGENFEELAKQYSEDITADSGGDLGFFSRGEMVPEFEEAAFNLDEGQISDLVKSRYGYHVIKILEKITNEETGETEQVRASHILIRGISLGNYIEDLQERSKIIKLIDFGE